MTQELSFSDLARCQLPVVLAPKNEVTMVVAEYLQQHGVQVLGYSDSVLHDADCLPDTEIPANCISLLFSISHWRAIHPRLAHTRCLVIAAVDGGYRFIPYADFSGYSDAQVILFNNTLAQKRFWQSNIDSYLQKGEDIERYGYSWGDPERADDELGNYLWINQQVNSWIQPDTVLLDLGTMSGKWLKFLLTAGTIVCVDINDAFIDVVSRRFAAQREKFQFYQTRGDELDGIATQSIDVLFCMDTLVRVEKQNIDAYFREFSRVLRAGGKFLIHLPCVSLPGCTSRNFTALTMTDVRALADLLGRPYQLRTDVLVHGVLIMSVAD